LAFASLQRLATAFPKPGDFTLEHYRTAFSLNAVRSAMGNSLLLGFLTATIGIVLTGLIAWMIQRSRLPGRNMLEYIVMFPQAVPRLVFAFGMMWAWLVFPLPVYGTLWILLIAYLTVFLPRRAYDLRRSRTARQEPRGMRRGLRRKLVLSDAHDHHAAPAAGAHCGVASDLRRQRARTRRLDPADGAEQQGADAGHRRGVLLLVERTHRGDGADPDRRGRRRHARLPHGLAPRRASRSLKPWPPPRTSR